MGAEPAMPPHEINTRVARVYMRPDGIAVANNLPNVGEQSLGDAKENMRAIAIITGGVRVPLLIDSPAAMSAEARRYYLSEDPHLLVTAVGIVAGNVLSRVLANLFIPVQKQPVPMKLFGTENEALAWLRQYKTGRKT